MIRCDINGTPRRPLEARERYSGGNFEHPYGPPVYTERYDFIGEGYDPVEHPAHYTMGQIEVIAFIEDQALPYHLGNVVKYVCRAAHKGAELEDLKKARWYLERYIGLKEKA